MVTGGNFIIAGINTGTWIIAYRSPHVGVSSRRDQEAEEEDEVEVENGGAVKNMAACEELGGRLCIVKHRLRMWRGHYSNRSSVNLLIVS